MPPVRVATEEAFQLGEGPVWDAATGRLLWVDIVAGRVFEGELADGWITPRERAALPEMVGAVAPGAGGELVLAAQERLRMVAPDGTLLTGPRVVPEGSGRRLNDGAVDPAGRYLAGSMSLTDPTGADVLVRLEPDGSLTTLDDDLGLSNGLAWSTDGTRMYNADTAAGTVFVRDYDPGGPAVGPREVHLALGPLSPDGIAVDSAEHLWVALWGAGEVRRYAPDGSPAGRLEIPVPNVTSVGFAGERLDTLVVTTAREDLSDQQLRDHPHAGRIFVTTVDVAGQSRTPWAGADGFR